MSKISQEVVSSDSLHNESTHDLTSSVHDKGAEEESDRPHSRWLRAAIVIAAAFIIGAIVGRLFPPFVLDSEFWRDFLTSAGFGGVMAVIAAVIAYLAARHGAASARNQAEEDRSQRTRSDRKEQWWARAQWALNEVVKGNADIGYKMLDALAESEWAGEHESDVIAAATDDALLAEEVPSDSDGAFGEGVIHWVSRSLGRHHGSGPKCSPKGSAAAGRQVTREG